MRHRQSHQSSDHFWAGFLTGALAGGVVGVIFGTEVGRGARERLETALSDVRGRWNGHSGASPDLEVQPPSEEPSS